MEPAPEASNPARPARPKPKSGIVTPHRASLAQRFIARAIWLLICTMQATLRVRFQDDSGCFTPEHAARPVIFAVWHNRLALSALIYRLTVRRKFPARRLAALVSASRDGGLLTRVLQLFEMHAARGSSSRRGAQALVELRRAAARGLDLAITPDGPRGPCYSVQDGVIVAAKVTGLAIIPISCHAQWKIRLGSWDRFQIPLPFSRVQIRAGAPLHVPADCPETELPRLREDLRQRLVALLPE